MPVLSTRGAASVSGFRAGGGAAQAPTTMTAYFPGAASTYEIDLGDSVLITGVFDGTVQNDEIVTMTFRYHPWAEAYATLQENNYTATEFKTDWVLFETGNENSSGQYTFKIIATKAAGGTVESGEIVLTVNGGE